MKNRLQLRHSDRLFETRDAVIEYIKDQMIFEPNKQALFAEPLVFKYGEDELNPNIILAIGSYGLGINDNDNNYFIIDTATLESDIKVIKTQLGLDENEIDKIKEVIDSLAEKDRQLSTVLGQVGDALQFEIDRAKAAEKSNADNIAANATAIANEITRATEKDTEHDAKIQENKDAILAEIERAQSVEDSITVYAKDTDTIDLKKVSGDTGITISGNLRLSSISGNQLIVSDPSVGGGLYYNVDIAYETTDENALLKLYVNRELAKTINLPLEKFLKSASYDTVRTELVLEFAVEGKNTETVRIPVGTLVDVYTAGLGLNLNDHEFSLKLNQTASENFVSLNEEGLAINGIQTAIDSAVKTESDRAKAAEKSNSDNIAANATAIANEITRATNIENGLNTKIEAEASRATERENDLAIDVERNTTSVSELSGKTETVKSDLASEVSRAMDAESTLNTKIDSEITRSTERDNAFANLISSNTASISGLTTDLNKVKGDLSAEITRATEAEGSLDSRISAEEGKVELNTTHIHELGEAITNEVNRATDAENVNASAISDETARAIAKEGELLTAITGEVSRATERETSINNALTERINTEITRAKGEEERLQQAIENEVITARNEEGKLKEQIDNIVIPEYSIVKRDSTSGDTPYASEYFLSKDGATALGATITITKDQFLQNVEYNEETKVLVFTFSTTDSGTKTISIPLADFADEYVAGEGLKLAGNEFRVNVSDEAESSKYLSVDTNGVKITGVDTAISNAVDFEKNRAIIEENRIKSDLDEEKNTRSLADKIVWVNSESPYTKTVELTYSQNAEGNTTLQTQIRLAGATVTLPQGSAINQILGTYPDGTLFADGRTSNILHEVDEEGHKTFLDTIISNLETRLANSESTLTEVRDIANEALIVARAAKESVDNLTANLQMLVKGYVLEAVSEEDVQQQITTNVMNSVISEDVFKPAIDAVGNKDISITIDSGKTVTIGLSDDATIEGVSYPV